MHGAVAAGSGGGVDMDVISMSAVECLRLLAEHRRAVDRATLLVIADRVEAGDRFWYDGDSDPFHKVDRGGRDRKLMTLGAIKAMDQARGILYAAASGEEADDMIRKEVDRLRLEMDGL